MTEQEYRERMIAEITDLKSSFTNLANTLTQKMDALEERMAMTLSNTEGRMKGRHELLEKDMAGLSSRIDEKVGDANRKIAKNEVHREGCADRRAVINLKIDDNYKELQKAIKDEYEILATHTTILRVISTVGALIGAAALYAFFELVLR